FADVALVVHTRAAGIDACAAGSWHGVRVLACTRLPRSLDKTRAADIRLRVTAPVVAGTGVAHVTWSRDGKPRAVRGHLDLDVGAAATNGIAITNAHVTLDADGTLSPLALGITGTARAASIDRGGMRVRDAELPFAFDIAHDVVPRTALVVHAQS